MKKKILILFIHTTIFLRFLGQPSGGFTYQTFLRNSNGILLNQVPIAIRVTIQQGNIGGTSVYDELFLSATNSYGLVNLEIGSGTSTRDFSMINWANGPYFLETAINFLSGTPWVVVSTSQILSVPYAFHSNLADSIIGDISSQENDHLFLSSIAATINSSDTALWNNYIDADTQLDSIDIANLGFTVGRTIDTDTQLDSIDIANLGFVPGPINIIDTDTQLDSIDIANLGFVSSKTYSIGMSPELGGFVFRISSNGKHGLVCETQTQSNGSSWYGCDSLIKNPVYHSPDAKIFFDWRLPTKYELNEIYFHRIAIGNLGTYSYWTSTEYDFGKAWKQNFGLNPTPGAQGLNGKSRTGSAVISVRSF